MYILEQIWRNIQIVTLVKGVGVVVGGKMIENRVLSHLSHTLLNVYFFIYKKYYFHNQEKCFKCLSSGKQPKLPSVENQLPLILDLLNRKNENKQIIKVGFMMV